jgi:hypothetical protein
MNQTHYLTQNFPVRDGFKYIYLLREPGTDNVRYIGCTKKPAIRASQHAKTGDWEMKILDLVPEDKAADFEAAYIHIYLRAGHQLRNKASVEKAKRRPEILKPCALKYNVKEWGLPEAWVIRRCANKSVTAKVVLEEIAPRAANVGPVYSSDRFSDDQPPPTGKYANRWAYEEATGRSFY